MPNDKDADYQYPKSPIAKAVCLLCVIAAYFSMCVFLVSYLYLLWATAMSGYGYAVSHYAEFIGQVLGG